MHFRCIPPNLRQLIESYLLLLGDHSSVSYTMAVRISVTLPVYLLYITLPSLT